MPDTMQNESPASMSALVGGIINDAQTLIRQEVALIRRELQDEINKAKTAAISLGVGTGVAFLGLIMLCFMLVHLLHWLTGAADPRALPLWGCYGIVALVFFIIGGFLFYVAKSKVNEMHLVPPQTAESMKENVQWIKNQT